MTAFAPVPARLHGLGVPAAALTMGALAAALFMWPAPQPKVRTAMEGPIPRIEAPPASETRREIRRISIAPAAIAQETPVPVAQPVVTADPIHVVAEQPSAEPDRPTKRIAVSTAPVRKTSAPSKDVRTPAPVRNAAVRQSAPQGRVVVQQETLGFVDRTLRAGMHATGFVVASARDTKDAALGLGRSVVGFVEDRL